MTTGEQILQLLSSPPATAADLGACADRFLALMAQAAVPTVAVEVVAGEPARLTVVTTDGTVETADPGAVRGFRPFLARLARKTEEEIGVPADPHGGRLTFDRPTDAGCSRVELEFENTPAAQRLLATRRGPTPTLSETVVVPALKNLRRRG
jgi:hypothetical protein